MSKYDAIVVGAGAAGLTAAALLAKLGKKVLLVERDQYLGGRAMAVPFEGFRMNLGGHLLEDAGDGITAISEYLGDPIQHGPVSSCMPIFKDGKWLEVRDLYSSDKAELKKVIKALVESPEAEFEQWDNRPLRAWMQQHTSHEGVIALWEFLAMLECLTEFPWDHSASDNLYTRKNHYSLKRIAGYSCWPVGGWDGLFGQLARAARNSGAEIRTSTAVSQVLVENGRVRGVSIERWVDGRKATPNEFPDIEVAEADVVLVTVPVWNLLDIVDESLLPDWLSTQVKRLAMDQFKVSWLGMHVATHEPVHVQDPLELGCWFHAPRTNLCGWAFSPSGYDPSTAPPGQHIWHCGYAFQGIGTRRWLEEKFNAMEQEIGEMFPGTTGSNVIWKRRHLVQKPAFGVIQKPGLVGMHRPDQTVPTIQGLYLAGETYKSRGIGVDRAGRSALSAVELIQGKRIQEIQGWRY